MYWFDADGNPEIEYLTPDKAAYAVAGGPAPCCLVDALTRESVFEFKHGQWGIDSRRLHNRQIVEFDRREVAGDVEGRGASGFARAGHSAAQEHRPAVVVAGDRGALGINPVAAIINSAPTQQRKSFAFRGSDSDRRKEKANLDKYVEAKRMADAKLN
jgi:hypothetical protein